MSSNPQEGGRGSGRRSPRSGGGGGRGSGRRSPRSSGGGGRGAGSPRGRRPSAVSPRAGGGGSRGPIPVAEPVHFTDLDNSSPHLYVRTFPHFDRRQASGSGRESEVIPGQIMQTGINSRVVFPRQHIPIALQYAVGREPPNNDAEWIILDDEFGGQNGDNIDDWIIVQGGQGRGRGRGQGRGRGHGGGRGRGGSRCVCQNCRMRNA